MLAILLAPPPIQRCFSGVLQGGCEENCDIMLLVGWELDWPPQCLAASLAVALALLDMTPNRGEKPRIFDFRR